MKKINKSKYLFILGDVISNFHVPPGEVVSETMLTPDEIS
jgi:hypothetical protein